MCGKPSKCSTRLLTLLELSETILQEVRLVFLPALIPSATLLMWGRRSSWFMSPPSHQMMEWVNLNGDPCPTHRAQGPVSKPLEPPIAWKVPQGSHHFPLNLPPLSIPTHPPQKTGKSLFSPVPCLPLTASKASLSSPYAEPPEK